MKNLLLTTMIILLFLVGFSCAYQKKMTLDNCIYSFNEEADSNGNVPFNAWNQNSNSGVFMKIANANKVLGETQNIQLIYTFYQNNGNSRNYYNNSAYTDKQSILPILNVIPGKSNQVYVKCSFVTGAYDIYIQDLELLYHGDNHGSHLSEDFNLTKGIISGDANIIRSSVITNLSNGTLLTNPITYSEVRGSGTQSNLFVLFNNTIDAPLYNQDPRYNISYLYSRRFYPNSNPIVIQKINLTQFSSGEFSILPLVRENNNMYLFDYFTSYFYINNSDSSSISSKIFPSLKNTNISIYKKDGTVKSFSTSSSGLACSRNSAFNACVLIEQGDKITSNYTFVNKFSIPITDVYLRSAIDSGSEIYGSGGVAISYGQNSPPATVTNQFVNLFLSDYMNFSPYEEKSFYSEFTVPYGDYPLLRIAATKVFYSQYGNDAVNYFRVGGEKIESLGINRINPFISFDMDSSSGSYSPQFTLFVDLLFYDTSIYPDFIPSLDPDEYSIFVSLVNQTGHSKDSVQYFLNESTFRALGFCNGESCSLGPGIYTVNFSFPIKQKYISDYLNNNEIYRVVIYTNKTSSPFKGLFARSKVFPYFEPGDIARSIKDVLYFYSNSPQDSGKVLLFNPSFYEIDLNLSINSLSSNKLNVSYPKSVHLNPLQYKEVFLNVNATYSPGVTSQESHSFILNVSSSLKFGENTIARSVSLPFTLNVINSTSTPYCDVYVTGISPQELIFEYFGQNRTQSFNASWELDSSNPNPCLGEGYTIVLEIINNNLSKTVKSIIKNYSTENKSNFISFDYEFSSEYLYSIQLRLDSLNILNESNHFGISGGETKTNNFRKYDLLSRIGGCYYNSTNYRVTYLDILQNKIQDSDCSHCKTTCEDKGFVCYYGFCANPGPADINCSYNTLERCNNFSYHLENNNNDLCAWSVADSKSNCISCNSIFDSCGGYNNEKTCNSDPCGKSQKDKANLKIGSVSTSNCLWTNNACNFVYSGCSYKIETSACGEGNTNYIIKYTNINTGVSNCEDKTISIPCASQVELSFFGFANIILSLIIIFGIYFVLFHKKHRRA